MSNWREPKFERPARPLGPRRAELLAGLAICIALLSLGWSLANGRKTEEADEQAAADASDAPDAPRAPITVEGLTLDQLSAASAQVVASSSQSVVRVEVAFNRPAPQVDDLETFFGRLPQEQLGSGVVVDADGYVLTNYHVVRAADNISLVRFDGKSHEAQLVGHDSLTDLALLHAPQLALPAVQWADSEQVASGHLVWAIGAPYGLDQSVSMGVVSSTQRPTLLDSPFQDFLQTDASSNPGNSGGALIDSRGELLGINTAIAGDSFRGISFALPSNTARQVYLQLRQQGEMPRGWIGVQLGNVTPARAAQAQLSHLGGAYVESLASGGASPAQEAGIRVADICLQFEGQAVSGPLGLIRQIAAHPIGTTAKLTVVRDGQQMQLAVEVRARP
ncbi:MAG: trypsin-like peptidase domain-containing protein [Planctomycetales bacterium]|nr:trypsin-like peptidase domain-containing protein [Planctomycetales bacterium]